MSVPAKKSSHKLRLIGEVLLVILAVSFVRATFINYFWVPSASMQPTISEGQLIFSNMTAYGYRVPFTDHFLVRKKMPQPGEVVIAFDPRSDVRIVKRVVAVPGQIVSVKQGHVFIDGKSLASSSIKDQEYFSSSHSPFINLSHGPGPDLDPILVPDDQFLLMGDNRGNSLDGRFFGFVSADKIHGRVFID